MVIKTAEYKTSSPRADMCPQSTMPEYAFIGRSNVGKSSLINMLTERNKLALTSSTPGKTMLINHFLINNEWYLVDLPGYGYATVEDRGGAIKGPHRLDLWFSSAREARQWGRKKNVPVTVFSKE